LFHFVSFHTHRNVKLTRTCVAAVRACSILAGGLFLALGLGRTSCSHMRGNSNRSPWHRGASKAKPPSGCHTRKWRGCPKDTDATRSQTKMGSSSRCSGSPLQFSTSYTFTFTCAHATTHRYHAERPPWPISQPHMRFVSTAPRTAAHQHTRFARKGCHRARTALNGRCAGELRYAGCSRPAAAAAAAASDTEAASSCSSGGSTPAGKLCPPYAYATGPNHATRRLLSPPCCGGGGAAAAASPSAAAFAAVAPAALPHPPAGPATRYARGASPSASSTAARLSSLHPRTRLTPAAAAASSSY
jgi:hypothetical protein